MLDHSTNVSNMINVSFPISVISKAIPGRFSGRACDGSVRFVVKQENEVSSLYLHKCKKHGKGNGRSCGFVHDGKKVKRTLEIYIAKKES